MRRPEPPRPPRPPRPIRPRRAGHCPRRVIAFPDDDRHPIRLVRSGLPRRTRRQIALGMLRHRREIARAAWGHKQARKKDSVSPSTSLPENRPRTSVMAIMAGSVR